MRIPMLSPLAAWSSSLTHSIETYAKARKVIVIDEAAMTAATKMAKIKKKLEADANLNEVFLEIRKQIEEPSSAK